VRQQFDTEGPKQSRERRIMIHGRVRVESALTDLLTPSLPRQRTRLRGQSLTGDSHTDSRLAFGGGLGRADWCYGRRMGCDQAAAAA
jgi:hypothetical protein